MKSSVIGLGKLGLPFALFLASRGQKVICFDKNKKILDLLLKKRSPYIEPKTLKYLREYNKKIFVTKDLNQLVYGSNLTHLVLPTPSLKNNSFSNKYLIECLEELSVALLKKRNTQHIINITSTVMPGSCKNIFTKIMESKNLKNNKDFLITYNPHFIAQGTTIYNLENPDFILIGSDNKKSEKLTSYYKKIYNNKVKISLLNTMEAEIAKIAINSYITTKITFSNFISEICQNTKNVDASSILNTIGKDHRIGNSYLGVGTKYSGPCFPRDNKALHYFIKGKTKNSLPNFIDKINNEQTKRLLEMLKEIIKKEKIKKLAIGVYGLTYKDKTSIIKDSQSYDLIKSLRFNYRETFNVYDENVKPSQKYLKNKKLIYFKNLRDFIQSNKIIFLMYANQKIEREIIKYKDKIIIDCWDRIEEKKTNSKIFKLGKKIL